MHAGQAFAASYLGSTLTKTMEGCVAFRNLHDLRVAVIGVTADERRLSGERELHGALAPSQLGFSALANVSRQALDMQQPAAAIELGSCRLLHPDLAPIPTAKAEGQGICRIVRAQFAYLRVEGL